MIRISDAAMAMCHRTVQQLAGSQTDSKCLRLLQCNGRFSISFELPRSGDRIVHHLGQSVVAIPDDALDDLSGKTLDLTDDGNLVIA